MPFQVLADSNNSNPAFEQMFKMNAQTDAGGMVNRIDVTVFDSLENMYADLALDAQLHEGSGQFKYRRSQDELILDFL